MQDYLNFLISVVPYLIAFFSIVIAAIIILKIAIYVREKKLSKQPCESFNRFDLPEDEEESNKAEEQKDDSA